MNCGVVHDESALAAIEAAIAEVEAGLELLENKKKAILKKTKIKCLNSHWGPSTYCGAEHMVSDLVYLQSWWYVSPYSCSGGDYWKPGEGRFICPICGALNRLIYEREEISKLKKYFARVEDVHD